MRMPKDGSPLLFIIIVFLIYINIGNFFNIIFFNVTESSFFSNIAPAFKDIYLLSLGFLAMIVVLKRPVINKRDVPLVGFILLFIGLLIVSYFLSSADISYKIYNFRRILTEYLAILTFMYLAVNTSMYYKILKTVLFLGIFICAFGIVEILLPIEFWDSVVGLPAFWNAREYIDVEYISIAETGGKAYTSDLYFIVGNKLRRMISFFAEATTLGSLITFLFTYFSFSRHFKYRKIILLLFLVSGLLVFSKAFLLSLVIVIIYKYLNKPKMYPVVVLSGIFVTFGAYTYLVLGKVHGSFSHFIGLYTGIEVSLLKPLGLGLGIAGNRGQFAISTVNGLNGGESGWGNVLAQMGISGFLSILILILIMKKFQNYYFQTLDQEYFAIFVATVNYYFMYLLSASSLGFTGNIVFFTFIGLMLNQKVLKENLYAKTI